MGRKHGGSEEEIELVNRKLERLDKEIDSGKEEAADPKRGPWEICKNT